MINIYSLRNWSGNVLYISVSRNFLYNIFLSLLLDSVLRSVIPFPHSRFNILRLPSSLLKCALVYRKFLFGEAATMSLL